MEDQGSTVAALGFSLLAVALLTASAAVAVSAVTLTSTVRQVSSVEAATDLRFSEWVMGEEQGAADPAQVCYPVYTTCVEVLAVTDVAAGKAVTLSATRGSGAPVVRTRVRYNASPTHISGFDTEGNPVWVYAATP